MVSDLTAQARICKITPDALRRGTRDVPGQNSGPLGYRCWTPSRPMACHTISHTSHTSHSASSRLLSQVLFLRPGAARPAAGRDHRCCDHYAGPGRATFQDFVVLFATMGLALAFALEDYISCLSPSRRQILSTRYSLTRHLAVRSRALIRRQL